METLKEMVEGVRVDTTGKVSGSLRVEHLCVDVEVLDIRTVWGRKDYLVTPIQGGGQQWVSADRIIISALREKRGGRR